MTTPTIALDPRPPAKRLVAGRAWIETSPGTLVWKGAPPPPPPPPFVDGDLVRTRQTVKRDQKKLPAGTVCRVLSRVTATLFSIAPVTGADRVVQPWLLHCADLEPAATEGAS